MLTGKRILLLIFLIPYLSYSQDGQIITDDERILDSLSREAELIVTDTTGDKPNVAAIYSAVLPGLGQVYNNKAWKIPIIYGGFVLWGYIIKYNHDGYVESREALFAVQDGDDRTNVQPPFTESTSLDIIQRRTDFYRRNRDFVIILTIAWYLLNIVDAHVDGHLNEFTIEEDLSFNVRPMIEMSNYQTRNYGLTLTLNF